MRIHVQNMHLPQLVARYEGVMAALMSIGTVTELNTVSWNICGWLVWTEKGGACLQREDLTRVVVTNS